MLLDPWLPFGFTLPDGAVTRKALAEGSAWQIVATDGDGRALLVRPALALRWHDAKLVDEGAFRPFEFGDQSLLALTTGPSQVLAPLGEPRAINSKPEALAFALAFRATRQADRESNLADALYVERLGRILPSYGTAPHMPDDVLVGYWLTGGAQVSVRNFRELHRLLNWMNIEQLKDVVESAGFTVNEVLPTAQTAVPWQREQEGAAAPIERKPMGERFALPGRPALESFFHEHVIDIILNRERYKAFGAGFPGAIVLHGPPGCGKTFAIDKLVEFLGWPSFQIDAASVGSPYIHETSRKVAEVFERAMQNAPCVLVMDEMEAFLADRESGGSHHRVEEVAEFLRRIPEATQKDVLIVAMTNRIDMIDGAILRRGRFDHVVEVKMPDEEEVRALLETLLAPLPGGKEIEVDDYAQELAGRPLSDAAFLAREGARLAARGGKDKLDSECMDAALDKVLARETDSKKRMGFL